MKYVEYMPADSLKDFINCFWSIAPDDDASTPAGWDRTIPDGSLEFVLQLEEPMLRRTLHGNTVREDRNILIGQATQPYLIAPTGTTRMLGVRFFPHTGHLFVDGPVASFNDQAVSLDDILPHRARLPIERIRNADSLPEAIRVLEAWCLARLRTHSFNTRDGYFSHACRTILQDRGATSIAALSRDLGISNRYLEGLFHARTGISPKLFARIIRFQYALGQMTGNARPALATVAQESGHHDQSHFIREFRRFTGLAPREFMLERHPFTEHFATPDNSSYLYNFR